MNMKKRFLEGIKDGIPICLGYFSVSMAFGLAVAQAGIPVWIAVMISLSNLTSAGQVAGTNILIAGGNMIELAMTTLIINIRYFLMSLSVSQKTDTRAGILKRMAMAFGITDEIFAVSMKHKGELTPAYMAGLILTPVIGWTSGTFLGAVANSIIPAAVSDAMGIALYGMFIAVIIPDAREHKNVFFVVILAILASLVFYFTPLKALSTGWSIIIITILVSGIAAFLFPVANANGEEEMEE